MIRVLTIDDNRSRAQALVMECLEHGVAVRVAESLCEGVRYLLDAPASLVLVDAGSSGMAIARTVADAVNDASDECCEVHVADVHDDEVYDAVSHFLQVGVPLWRRQGLHVPASVEGLDGG